MHKYVILSLCGIFAVFTLFIIFYNAINRDLLTSAGVTISAGFASVLSILVLYRGTKFHGLEVDKRQIFLVIGIWLWFGAEIIFGYYQIWLKTEAPFPSLADPIYLAGYAFFTYYLFRTLKILSQEIEREVLILVSLAVAVSFGYIMNLSFGVAQLISVENEILAMVVSVSYPILDGLLLVPAIVILWSAKKGDLSQNHWVMISLFIVLNAVGDLGFGYSAYIGTLNEETWFWDILFIAGYLTLITGLLWQNQSYSQNISTYHNRTNCIGASKENMSNGNSMK
jgi:hypothetical protein